MSQPAFDFDDVVPAFAKVGTEPVEDLRDPQLASLGDPIEVGWTREEVAGLVFELRDESISRIGLAPELRTAARGADEGVVNPGLSEFGPDPFVLQLVQADDAARQVPALGFPAFPGRDIPDRVDARMIENELQRERIVGVEQQGELGVARKPRDVHC